MFPRWLLGLRGRRIPPLVAVVPAALGSLILTALWTWTGITFAFGRTIQWQPMTPDNPLNVEHWQGWLAVVCYAPLLLWGPLLLGALTIAYWRRRVTSPGSSGSSPGPAARTRRTTA